MHKQMTVWWRAAAGLRKVTTAASGSRPSHSFSGYHTIQAIPREYSGSRISARDRAQGRIPAVVYTESFLTENRDGGGAAVRSVSRKHILTTEKKQVQAILDTVRPEFFCSTTFPFQIRAGSGSSVLLHSGTVLPIKIHVAQESGKILNLVFVWAENGSDLKVDVPVVFKGEDVCPGLKKGGCLNRVRTSLKYLCPAEHIPQKIEVDISNLDIDDRVLMSDIQVHPSLKLLSKNETMPVCKIVATQIVEAPQPAQD